MEESDPFASRRSLRKGARLPQLSGKASAAWLVVCFVLTALLIPMTLRLPLWVDFEIVLAVWWVIWLGVLTRLLYGGHMVTDDHQMHEPRNWFASGDGKSAPASRSGGSWWDWGWFVPDGDALLIIIGLILLIGLIWFLLEIAIPLIIFLLYVVTRGMLARVVNDRHHCQGRLDRSLGWATVWATVNTVPLAAAVWFIHFAYVKAHTPP
jgi:hypothetical protein